MDAVDKLIANTQRNVTYLYMALFAAAIAGLIFLPKPLDDSVKTILITMLGILGTLVTMQNQFWFARPRSAGVPDPTVITTTSPPGQTVSVTNPKEVP